MPRQNPNISIEIHEQINYLINTLIELGVDEDPEELRASINKLIED